MKTESKIIITILFCFSNIFTSNVFANHLDNGNSICISSGTVNSTEDYAFGSSFTIFNNTANCSQKVTLTGDVVAFVDNKNDLYLHSTLKENLTLGSCLPASGVNTYERDFGEETLIKNLGPVPTNNDATTTVNETVAYTKSVEDSEISYEIFVFHAKTNGTRWSNMDIKPSYFNVLSPSHALCGDKGSNCNNFFPALIAFNDQYNVYTNTDLDTCFEHTTSSPDLIVQSPGVNDSTLNPGQSFTLSARVKNQGAGTSPSTTLRYYRSSNSVILPNDTQVGTDVISSLSPGGTSAENVSLTAPSTPGTYYYGACAVAVNGESNTGNNCSAGAVVTVSEATTSALNMAPIISLLLADDNLRPPSKVPNQRCGLGRVYDCALTCVQKGITTAWQGDGVCDDGTFAYFDGALNKDVFLNLNCPVFNNDGGDC